MLIVVSYGVTGTAIACSSIVAGGLSWTVRNERRCDMRKHGCRSIRILYSFIWQRRQPSQHYDDPVFF
jgi:hypothetical protein